MMKHPLNMLIAGGLLALASAAQAGTGSPNGTHPDGHGGAVCKGFGHCLVLEIDCKGTYTDATDSEGTVYGKCDKLMKAPLKLKANEKRTGFARTGKAKISQ